MIYGYARVSTDGRKPKLTPHQMKEAIRRRDRGKETLQEIAGSYNVSHSTISPLTAAWMTAADYPALAAYA